MRKHTLFFCLLFCFFCAFPAFGKSLVAYFSRTGEQYGVGVITEGNTAKVAKEIARQTGADLFEIVADVDYSDRYRTLTEQAQEEKRAGARPSLVKDIDISSYDTIYLGYPIWWGDMPMVLYTFLETHDWKGKTVYPFSTHEGSGLAGTPEKIRKTIPGATVGKGLAIRGRTAQNDPEAVREAVEGWLGR